MNGNTFLKLCAKIRVLLERNKQSRSASVSWFEKPTVRDLQNSSYPNVKHYKNKPLEYLNNSLECNEKLWSWMQMHFPSFLF